MSAKKLRDGPAQRQIDVTYVVVRHILILVTLEMEYRENV